jgi:hypothetical protein
MKKLNTTLAVSIVLVLLLPLIFVGASVSACCGVAASGLYVTDAPDPACVGDEVTISGNYTVDWYPGMGDLGDEYTYDTGVNIEVWDPEGNLVMDGNVTLGSGLQPVPQGMSFGFDITVDLCGNYTYEVIAWSVDDWGRVETDIVGGTIDVCICDVAIDIKPGSDPNSINSTSKGVIPVAILTTDDFDAATVDPATVRFGPNEAAPIRWALEDVDRDGDMDLSLKFDTQTVGFAPGDTEATLTGETLGGCCFWGTDSVRIVK